jgi:hypothetical protein
METIHGHTFFISRLNSRLPESPLLKTRGLLFFLNKHKFSEIQHHVDY